MRKKRGGKCGWLGDFLKEFSLLQQEEEENDKREQEGENEQLVMPFLWRIICQLERERERL